MLSKELSEYNPVRIDGTVPTNERTQLVDRFQNDPNCRLFIGQIKAAGEGITLTAASHVAFAELEYVPGLMEQAADRVHRIGQKVAVTIWYLMGANTIDERILSILERKAKHIGAVVDGKFDEEEDVTVKNLYADMKRCA
jgi:SNF2 family DNA or RNA helicase